MKNSSSNTKKIVRDEFTQKLINVNVELVKRDAIAKKKDFSDALGITGHFWNHIESRKNNFPRDQEKRTNAAKALADLYFVSMDYLLGNSERMFTKEPLKQKLAMGAKAAGLDFRNKAEKKAVLDELEACKKRVAQLEKILADAGMSDNNPDK